MKKSIWDDKQFLLIVCHISYNSYLSPFLAHIIDQNVHLKIFESHFYKYILKIAFSQNLRWKQVLYVHLACHGLLIFCCSFHFLRIILQTFLMSYLNLIFWPIMADQLLIAQNLAPIQTQPKNSGHHGLRYGEGKKCASVHFPLTMRLT